MDDDLMVWIFVWLVVGGLVGAVIGSAKGNGGNGFALGCLLGPIGWIIVALLDYPRKCPDCQCGVPEGAAVCKGCGRELPRQSKQEPSLPGPSSDSERKKCPFCAELILREAIKCRYCGSPLPAATISTGSSPASPTHMYTDCPPSRKGKRSSAGGPKPFTLSSQSSAPPAPVKRPCIRVELKSFTLSSQFSAPLTQPALDNYKGGFARKVQRLCRTLPELLQNLKVSSLGLFARIKTREEALSRVRSAAQFLFFSAAADLVRGLAGNKTSLVLALVQAVLAFLLRRFNSRVAAVLALALAVLLLALISRDLIVLAVAPSLGRRIIWEALIALIVVLLVGFIIRVVEATFKLHGRYRTESATESTEGRHSKAQRTRLSGRDLVKGALRNFYGGLVFASKRAWSASVAQETEIGYACPRCGGAMLYLTVLAGQQAPCPLCGQTIKLPRHPSGYMAKIIGLCTLLVLIVALVAWLNHTSRNEPEKEQGSVPTSQPVHDLLRPLENRQ